MTGNKRILSTLMAFVLLLAVLIVPASAADAEQGIAAIGFSIGTSGGVTYIPGGISGVESTLDLDFGTHDIDLSQVGNTVDFESLNNAGYVVENSTGGKSGYRVTLGLSSFSNGLQGAWMRIQTDERGLVSDTGGADAPILFGGRPSLDLPSDGTSMVVMKASDYSDPLHTALGRWGFNFTGDLNVYRDTIRPGASYAVMTWEIQLV